MSDRRPYPSGGTEGSPMPDARLEHQVRAWLAAEPDRPPEGLTTAIQERARRTPQQPAWLAGLRRPARLQRPSMLLQLGAIVAGIVVVFVVAGIVGRPNPQPTPSLPNASSASPPPSPTPSAVVPFDGRAETVRTLDHPATALGSGFGSLWVGDAAKQLLRIDPATGGTIATIDLGGVPCGPIVAAASSLWLATCGEGATTGDAVTVRVDPSTNTGANTYESDGGDGLGAGAIQGLVWFISDVAAGRLTGANADTGAPERELTLERPIRAVAAGFGTLWVSPIGSPAVIRIDPRTGEQLAAVTLSGDAGFLATASDGIWVSEPHQWLVGRIDPVADRVATEVGAAPGAFHLTIADSGLVWALADVEALAVDPTLNQAVDRFPGPVHTAFDHIGTNVLTTFGEDVWFAAGRALLRIPPA